MLQAIKPYKKDFDYSYTLGVFLTIELLINKPDKVLTIILSAQGDKNSGVSKIKELAESLKIPMVINDKIISRLSPKENCYAIGLFSKYETDLEIKRNHVVLVNPMDSGNLGTILRTGLGFGITNIGIIRPAVDIFDPKTIRASMGALFGINFTYFEDFEVYQKLYPEQDLYPFMLHAKRGLQDIDPHIKEPFSLVFGNESSGLPSEFAEVGTSVVIPHSPSIDSLNLSMAVGIACYAFTKKDFGV